MIAIALLVSVVLVGLFGAAAMFVSARRQWRIARRAKEQRLAHAERLAEMERLARERAIVAADAAMLGALTLPPIEAPAPPRRAARGSVGMRIQGQAAAAVDSLAAPSVFVPGLARARVAK